MVNIRYTDTEWRNNKLYLLGRSTGYRVEPSETANMYRIRFRGGGYSEHHYSLSHAKNNCIEVALHELHTHSKIKGEWHSANARSILREMGSRIA